MGFMVLSEIVKFTVKTLQNGFFRRVHTDYRTREIVFLLVGKHLIKLFITFYAKQRYLTYDIAIEL